MKTERITGAICFIIILAALSWATVLENRTEKRMASAAPLAVCAAPDENGHYRVPWNSGCAAKLTEIEGLRLYNGTVCLNAGAEGWNCTTRVGLSK